MDFETALHLANFESTYILTPTSLVADLAHKRKTAYDIHRAEVALKKSVLFMKETKKIPAAVMQFADDWGEVRNAMTRPTMFSKANTAMTGVGAFISVVNLGNTIYNYKQGEASGCDVWHDIGTTGNAFLGFAPGVGTIASAIITGIDLVSTPLLTAAYTQYYIGKSYGAPSTGVPGIIHGQTNYCHY